MHSAHFPFLNNSIIDYKKCPIHLVPGRREEFFSWAGPDCFPQCTIVHRAIAYIIDSAPSVQHLAPLQQPAGVTNPFCPFRFNIYCVRNFKMAIYTLCSLVGLTQVTECIIALLSNQMQCPVPSSLYYCIVIKPNTVPQMGHCPMPTGMYYYIVIEPNTAPSAK